MSGFPATILLSFAAIAYAPDPVEVKLPLPHQLALARVAGFTVKGSAVMDECDQKIDQMHYSQTDLNGDKVPELVVSGYSLCYGNGGSVFTILRKMPAGWREIGGGNGSIGVLKTVHRGWHDVEIGGPGFGKMPVMIWNGTRYNE